MLHLFNKVYLEFDDNIEINFDRVVISEQYGKKMMIELDKVAYGELIKFGLTYDEVIENDFIAFLEKLRDFSSQSGKKIIIYCDKTAYKKFTTQWFKGILPSLDFEGFKTIVDHTIYNQRIISNTQLSSVYSMSLNTLWEDLGDLQTFWDEATKFTAKEKKAFKSLGLNLSYELMIADHLSGSKNYTAQLKSTMHMFLRRWFKELLTDNRQMVLLNINNHRFQTAMDIDPSLVDITREDPLAGIPGLEAYADNQIWEMQSGNCNLAGLSDEQINGLRNTLISVYDRFEGMQIDRSVFGLSSYLNAASRDELTDDEMQELLTFVINEPFDTNMIPRFDFQNVNFVLFLYFLRQKFEGADLSKYKLV